MGPGLQSSLSSVLAVILASATMLQCSRSTNALVMHRLPVAKERFYQEEGEDFEASEEYDANYEDDLNKAIEKATVRGIHTIC